MLLFFTTKIKELNFWWENIIRNLNTTSNDGKWNLNSYRLYLALVLYTQKHRNLYIERGNSR